MKYVIDAGIAFMWEVTESLSGKAHLLRDDFRKGIHALHAPDHFVNEVANALMVAEHRGRILRGQAVLFIADLFTTLPILHPTLPDLSTRALEIATQSVASVYYGLYVALAEELHCDLFTADDKLVNNLHAQFPFIKHLRNLP